MNALSLCLTSAGCFFLVGLLSGSWKYARIRRSAEARAPVYVDVVHRASLMYAFANVLLARFVERSRWMDRTNLVAASVLELFFATSVAGYALHGLLRDTDNQFRRPHRLGSLIVPDAALTAYMVALTGTEIVAFVILFSGFLLA